MTDLDTAALLAEANDYAQRCFRRMLENKTYSDKRSPDVQAYELAERVMDMLLDEAQGESQAGDHYLRPTG